MLPARFSRAETGCAETGLVQKSSSTEQDSPLQAAPSSEVLAVQPTAELPGQAQPELLFLCDFSSSNLERQQAHLHSKWQEEREG